MRKLLMFLAFWVGLTGGLAAQTTQTAKAAASYKDTIYLTYRLSADDTMGQIPGLTLANGASIIYCDWGDGITESYTVDPYTDWKGETTLTFGNLKHSWKMKTGDVRVKIYGTDIRTRLLYLDVGCRYQEGVKLVKIDLNGCTALTYLYCVDNQLVTLDVSGCTALTTLKCENNQLTSLDVSGYTALTTLWCENNQLTSLDVSGCTALTDLWCFDNNLTSLDVSGCTSLTTLWCYNNNLTSLDVSGCTALTALECHNNKLTSLDVSSCTALISLSCGANQLTSLDVSGCTVLRTLYCNNNQLTSLDVSKNTALTSLSCDENQLTSLDMSKNTALMELYCSSNQLTSLDVSKNTALLLYLLDCSDNQLTSLDVSGGTALMTLKCGNNQLTILDVSSCTALTYLSCKDNQLTSLNVSGCTALTTLGCYNNQLTSLDVSGCTALTYLSCGDDQLVTLNASGCTALRSLYYTDNKLDSLDVSGCTALTTLWCENNQLTSLDVSGCTALTELRCFDNNLTSLDVSGCTSLTTLWCYNNNLISLDVSGCMSLTTLRCENNNLTSLDVSGCTALTNLDCRSNQLTSLDVSKNTALISLYCSNNQFVLITGQYDKTFDLSKLPGFDVERATDWSGGTVSGNMLTFTYEVVEYTYDTRYHDDYNKLKSFSLRRKVATLSKPMFTPNGGEVERGSTVAIRCATAQATIHYTTNGSTPTEKSAVYTEPIAVNEAMTIKAIALYNDQTSFVAEATFTIKPEMATPVFTPAGGEVERGSTVAIHCDTPDATIHYTLDGSTPTEQSAVYTAPIVVNEAMTIKALAVRENYVNSPVAEAVFTIKPEMAMPVFTPAGGEVERGSTVAIHCDTPDATIHYTLDGSTPTAQSTVYTAPIVVNEAMTIKALAVRENYVNSAVAEASFTIKPVDPIEPETPDTVAMPVFTPNGGEVAKGTTVTILCATENATVHYTTDGSTPTEESAVYTAPIVVNEAMTIKALAVRENYVNSPVAEAAFTVATVANEAGQTASRLVVYAQDRAICLSEAAGEVSVYTVDGRRVFCGKAVRIPVATGGLYIVHVAGKSYKLPVR